MFERKLALENVAFGQSPFAFEIERGDDLAVQDDVFDIRRVFGDGVDDVVAELFFFRVPVEAGRQLVGRVLHEARKNVFSRRRKRRIGERRNHHVDVGMRRPVAVFRFVVGLLHVLDAGRDRHRAAQVRADSRHALEIRQAVERHVDLAGRSAELVALHAFHEFVGQMAGLDHLGKREPRIDAGGNDVGINLVAVREHDADGASVLDR